MILMEEGGIVVGSKETGKEVQRLEIITEVEYFHERIRKCCLPVMIVSVGKPRLCLQCRRVTDTSQCPGSLLMFCLNHHTLA
jgi:hypothetical protein